MSGYPLVIGVDMEESRTEVDFSVGISYEKLGSSVVTAQEHRYGKI